MQDANAAKNHVRCRFCRWTVPLWRTGKNGKKVNGFKALQRHLIRFHRQEWERICRWVDGLEVTPYEPL